MSETKADGEGEFRLSVCPLIPHREATWQDRFKGEARQANRRSGYSAPMAATTRRAESGRMTG